MTERDSGAAGLPDGGSQHRAMVMFCDLVGSTELSGRHDPERYAQVLRRYISEVRTTIEDRFDGSVVSEAGDGLLALFGALSAHGDDPERAVRAGLEIVERVRALSAQTEQDIGEALAVRVGIHRGPIYRTADESIYGLTVNVAARLQTLAPANSVVVSEQVRRLVGDRFDTETDEPHAVKGLDEPVSAHRVLGAREDQSVRHHPGSNPLIDRLTQWKTLEHAWADVRRGDSRHSAALLMRGEAGIGKSHLVSRITALAAGEGATIVEMTGSAIEGAGLYPVRRLLERSVGLRRSAGATERLQGLHDDLVNRGMEPHRLVPRLAPILGLEPSAGYVAEPVDSRKLNEEVLAAAGAYVDSLLGEVPGVLVFEDVQWFDASTRMLMAQLVKRKMPSLVIMTGRPEVTPDADVEVMDLGPLSFDDAGLLVDALCPEPLDAELRSELVNRCDGIPLYVEELVANAKLGVPALPDASGQQAAVAVPDLLYDLLAARLAGAADVIPVATAAAVIGREVDRQLLQVLVPVPLSQLVTALETLCDHGVLERSSAGDGQYRFRHELLREVAYELQPPSRRRYVHGRAADELSARASGGRSVDWSVIGSHYEQAEQWLDASDAYERAAAAARSIGAFAQARHLVTRAIELLTASPADSERDLREVKLRLQRGYLAVSDESHASPAAAADYKRCLELTGGDPMGDEMFQTIIVLWTYHLIRGEIAAAREISRTTYRHLEQREWYRSFNLAAFAILECFEGQFGHARDTFESFMASRAADDEQRFVAAWFNPTEPVTGILTSVGLVRFVTGDVCGAEAAFAEALERAHSMDFPQGPYSVAYALSLEAWMRLELEQFDEADDRIARLAEIATRHGFDGWSMTATTQQTTLAALVADYATADGTNLSEHAASLQVLTDLWQQLDTRFFLPYYLMLVGVLYGKAGDERAARDYLEKSLHLASETGMDFWRSETLRHRACLGLHPIGRREGLVEALDLARRQEARLFELRIALDLAETPGGGGTTEIRQALGRLGSDPAYPEVARAEARLAPG